MFAEADRNGWTELTWRLVLEPDWSGHTKGPPGCDSPGQRNPLRVQLGPEQ